MLGSTAMSGGARVVFVLAWLATGGCGRVEAETSGTNALGAARVTSAGPDDGHPDGFAALRIYFVDVEGGQATILRFPNGEVMVVDSGHPGPRDHERIVHVLHRELDAKRIDYLLTTHYDGDHVGGVSALASRFEIGTFFDHGDAGAPAEYLEATRSGRRRVIAAGDQLDVGEVRFDFVASGGRVIEAPLSGAGLANPLCEGARIVPGRDENANSVGFVLHYGAFDFVNLADLLWELEHRLACPNHLLGEVELYLTSHHGLERSGAPQLVRALNPEAAIMNNGARKGGGGQTWETLAQVPGPEAVWQLHRNVRVLVSENAPEDQIANLEAGEADTAHFLWVHATADGRFRVGNPRNGFTRVYAAH